MDKVQGDKNKQITACNTSLFQKQACS